MLRKELVLRVLLSLVLLAAMSTPPGLAAPEGASAASGACVTIGTTPPSVGINLKCRPAGPIPGSVPCTTPNGVHLARATVVGVEGFLTGESLASARGVSTSAKAACISETARHAVVALMLRTHLPEALTDAHDASQAGGGA